MKKKKRATWGNPLKKNCCLLQLVGLIPFRPKKLNIKNISRGTPCKIPDVIFSCAAFVGFPKEDKSRLRKKRARWGNPLKISGCSLLLVELVPRQPKKLKSAMGELVSKLRFFSSVAPPSLYCLRRPRAANCIRLV